MRKSTRINGVLGLTALALASPAQSRAQNPLEGASGETAISVARGPMGFASVNTADKKVKVAWKHYLFSSSRFIGFGLDASVKATNSVGSLLRSGELVPETSINGRVERRLWRAKVDDAALDRCISNAQKEGLDQEACVQEFPIRGSAAALWGFLKAGYTAAEYQIFDPTGAYSSQLRKESFDGFQTEIGVNYWAANGGSPLLIGVSVGLREANSIAQMTEVTIRETSSETRDSSSATLREAFGKDKVAYEGAYQTFGTYPLKLDAFLAPANLNNLGIWTSLRALDPRGDRATEFSAGLGVFLFRDNNPLAPLGAIMVERRAHKDDWVANLIASVPVPF